MKMGFSKRLVSADPGFQKGLMAGRVINIGDIANYDQVTEKE